MRRNKYGVAPKHERTMDGRVFDSKAEARRYVELKTLRDAGVIVALRLQPEFECKVNGIKVCTYRADFQYTHVEDGREVIEDVKGVRTAVYKLKKKLVAALYGIEITEV